MDAGQGGDGGPLGPSLAGLRVPVRGQDAIDAGVGVRQLAVRKNGKMGLAEPAGEKMYLPGIRARGRISVCHCATGDWLRCGYRQRVSLGNALIASAEASGPLVSGAFVVSMGANHAPKTARVSTPRAVAAETASRVPLRGLHRRVAGRRRVTLPPPCFVQPEKLIGTLGCIGGSRGAESSFRAAVFHNARYA